MFSLKHKTAVITGGASGIGQAIALQFSRQGAKVILLDINKELGNAFASELPDAEFIECDVSRGDEVMAIFNNPALQSVNILVNSAGISHIGSIENTSEVDMNLLFNINVKGVFFAMKAALPLMKKSGGGVILNLASIAATIGLSDRFAYSMSKGAVLAMTLSVAKDYIRENIRCNCISPARIHTPFVDSFLSRNYPGRESEMFDKLSLTQPIGRMGTPQEVASLALYLCSDEASFVTGCDYPLDGGFFRLHG